MAGVGVGIVVGSDAGVESRLSRADYAVAGTAEALRFLEALRDRLAEEVP
jgi:hypothetical protein